MGKTIINNLSTFTDYAAIMKVAFFMAGDEYQATHDTTGKKVATIKKDNGNVYLITDSTEESSVNEKPLPGALGQSPTFGAERRYPD